jgi:site-specific recombinase XerD
LVPVEVDQVTVSDALAELIAAYKAAGRSPSTVEFLRLHVTRLDKFLMAQPGQNPPLMGYTVDRITTANVTAFIASEVERGLKPSSISISIRSIRRFLQWCVERDLITHNPAKRVMSPTVVVEPVKFLSAEQVDRLLRSVPTRMVEDIRDAAVLRLLLDTGLRRGELASLRVADVDLEAGTVTVRAATSKGRRGRTVPISSTTVAALRRWLRVRQSYIERNALRSHDALWVGNKGPVAPNGLLQAVRRRLAAAGLPPVSIHSFRHRYAAVALEQGIPTAYLMVTGGWRSPRMIDSRYGQFGISERAVTAMRAMLDGQPR